MGSYDYDYYHGVKSNYPKDGYETLDFDKMWEGLLRWLLDNFSRNKRLVDLGCGYGFLVAKASVIGYDAYGVDISEYAIDQGRKHNPRIASHLITAGGEQLSQIFMKNSIDVVIALEVLEHLECPKTVLQEIHNILKPKGFLCITTPTPDKPGYDETHVNIRTPKQWLMLLKSLSFEAHKFSFSISQKRVVQLVTNHSKLLNNGYRTVLATLNEKKYGCCNLLAQKI